MGRGRGQSSRAETSGIQGRVYAITPQTEPVDHSVIQSMFMLSRLWEKILFDSDATYSYLLLHNVLKVLA